MRSIVRQKTDRCDRVCPNLLPSLLLLEQSFRAVIPNLYAHAFNCKICPSDFRPDRLQIGLLTLLPTESVAKTLNFYLAEPLNLAPS